MSYHHTHFYGERHTGECHAYEKPNTAYRSNSSKPVPTVLSAIRNFFLSILVVFGLVWLAFMALDAQAEINRVEAIERHTQMVCEINPKDPECKW